MAVVGASRITGNGGGDNGRRHGAEMTDTISLQGLRIRGFHGVLPEERAVGQLFVTDVTLHLDTAAAAAADDIDLTVDYSTLAHQLAEVVAGDPVRLIETLAQ